MIERESRLYKVNAHSVDGRSGAHMEEGMSEVQPEVTPKTRIRKRRLDLALEAALRDAAGACENNADPSTKSLIQARLQILNYRLSRQENGKLVKALAEIEQLKAEVTRLQAEVAARSVSPADDIRAVLKNYGGTNA